MSTPASEALSAAATPPAAAPPAAATPAASADAFWNGWTAPEQKPIRDTIANKNFADPFALAKSYVELEGQAGTLRAAAALKGYPADKVNADGSVVKADENARKAWNSTMGVPETADKYDIPVPANNPYPQFKTMMQEEFHKAGVPAAMATVIAKGWESVIGKMQADVTAQEDAQSKASLLTLQQEWGSKYQENMALANRARTFFTKEVGGMTPDKERQVESVLGTATWLNLLAKIGAGNKEPGFAGAATPPGFANTASEAQARLDAIQAQRTAGTLKDFQWRELNKTGGEIEQLITRIANGMAPPNG